VPRRLRIAGCVISVLAAVACAAPARQAPDTTTGNAPAAERAAPKRLTAAIRGYPKSVSVAIDATGAGSTAGVRNVEQMLNDGFAVLDNEGQLQPRLAEAVPSIENGLWKLFPDGQMETTWRIRGGAVWQDGVPFTAEDVLFTATVARDRQLAILQEPAFEAIAAIEATDPRTVVVRWNKPYIWADSLLSSAGSGSILPMPRHLLLDSYTDDRANFTQHRYWGPDFVGDFSVMVANILAGAVEVTLGRGLSLEQGMEASARWREGRMEYALTNITALFPQFVNATPSVVSDVSFRRVVVHALDRQQLSDVLQAGVSPVSHNPLVPNSPEALATEGNAVRYDYDPQRAAQLIGGLGYTRGTDGLFRDAAGQLLAVKIQTTNDDLREKMLPVIGDFWRQAGVTMEPVMIARRLSSDRQIRAEFASFDLTRQPNDLTRYHSSQVPLLENSYRGSNRTRYRSADLDALIDRYTVTVPKDERNRVLGQMVHHVTDQLVIIGIFFIAEPALISNRITNVTSIKGDEALNTWNVHAWDLRS